MPANGFAMSCTPVMELSLVTSVMRDWTSAPVARVAMNESTRRTTTTSPLTSPTSRAAVMASATAVPGPRPAETRKRAVSTLVSDIVNATERSKTRAASGATTLSATSPATALPFRTCVTVVAVGNVSGAHAEKTTTMSSQTYRAPMFRNDSAATARRTGVRGARTADAADVSGSAGR